jgi:hypothetical protein
MRDHDTDVLSVRVPRSVTEAVEMAAARSLISKSDYTRIAVLDALRRETERGEAGVSVASELVAGVNANRRRWQQAEAERERQEMLQAERRRHPPPEPDMELKLTETRMSNDGMSPEEQQKLYDGLCNAAHSKGSKAYGAENFDLAIEGIRRHGQRTGKPLTQADVMQVVSREDGHDLLYQTGAEAIARDDSEWGNSAWQKLRAAQRAEHAKMKGRVK